MTLTKDKKQTIIEDFEIHKGDTGSVQVQIALLTERINSLTEHFKTHKKDHHSRRGLLRMVNQRRKLLKYVLKHAPEDYNKLIEKLKIRK